nr:PREDICTED: lysophosphatidic acid receptor 6-like [Lepisosteus oculatus]XP_015196213.1 PREDICTED: lysophosphatidic acid receptor 6-like [Lepisosteus oculatus]
MDNTTTLHSANWVFVGTYAVVFVAGLTLNLIALVVFFRHKKTRSHTTTYMTNLALADLLLVSTLPIRIYHHSGGSIQNQKMCETVGLILLVNMYGSIFLLTCISFDRCIAVCFPMSLRIKEHRKKAPLICLGVWILTIGASVPIYLSKNSTPTDGNITQSNKCFSSRPIYATQPLAITTTLTVGFGIPLFSMLVCSWCLIRAINKSTVAQTDLVNKKKIRRMIAANLAIFLLCFLPYHAMLFVLFLKRNTEQIEDNLLTVYQYSLMIACLNAMLDPLAYYFTTETFRTRVDVQNLKKKVWIFYSNSSDGQNRPHSPLNT